MNYINEILEKLNKKYMYEPEYLQAVQELLLSLTSIIEKNETLYREHSLLERIVIPDRIISFKVEWKDDKGNINVNNGYRVQYNNYLGPYKGGLRFHESVNISILKFLGFEQIFKNSLTGLPMGGGKGGSDFSPKGKSENEIKNFCDSFINGLYKYIGATIDVPAGDIGVGAREIGFMVDKYRNLTGLIDGTFTGKAIEKGGSLARKEATGYGVGYITESILEDIGDTLNNKTICISGSGNVATYALKKFIDLGAKVLTMSDSDGFIYDDDGIDFDIIKDIKELNRLRISEYVARKKTAKYYEGKRPWGIKCDIAAPCATQNEVSVSDVNELVKNGTKIIVEGANMPLFQDAANVAKANNILYMPGKASNAGGVSVSGLEMEQNAKHESWPFEVVDNRLKDIMKNIYKKVKESATLYSKPTDFVSGANIAGFKRLAEAMIKGA